MPGSRVYDVVVLGPDVGGAVAAALCARRGLRTLLAPMGRAAAGRESEGWLLPAAHPMVVPVRQLSASSACIDELGLGADLQRQAAATQGGFQILSDKLRLSLPADSTRRKTELWRELAGVQAAEAERAFDELEELGKPWDPFLAEPPPWPPRGFFEKRRVRKIVPVAPPLPEGIVGECLRALAPFAATLVGDSAPEATAREASALLRAPLRLWGGTAQVADLLRERLVAGGGEVTVEPASQVRLERKAALVHMDGTEVRASFVIFACGGAEIARLLEGGGKAEQKLIEETSLQVSRKVTLAHFVVHAEGLPLALEEAALLLGGEAGPLVISQLPARKVRGDASGERVLTVARVADGEYADGAAMLKSVRAALEPVLPFFERHIVHELADLSPSPGHPLLQPHEDAEPIGLRPSTETHERVMFASAATYPGFGLEGQFLAARAAADQALVLSGRKSISAT
jgi:phytoene dehydrogenase-like protein